MIEEEFKAAPPHSGVRVGMFTDLDPADSYVTVTLEVPNGQEDLTPDEARALAQLLCSFADDVDRKLEGSPHTVL